MNRKRGLDIKWHLAQARDQSIYGRKTILHLVQKSPTIHLLVPTLDLAQELLQHGPLEALALVNGSNTRPNLLDCLRLVLLVQASNVQVEVELLDLGLLLRVLAAVVLLQNLALLGSDNSESLVDKPRALVVEDISSNLANVLGVAVAVEVIILDLEVLAERDKDGSSSLQILLGGNTGHVHGEGDGEVEGVVGSLVNDDKLVLVERKVGEVDTILGGSEEVEELAVLGLESSFVEELKEVNIVGLLAEVLLESGIDGGLKHEGVVDGNCSNTLLLPGKH